MTQLEHAPPSAAFSALLQGWISRTDLARELGVCEETLRRWADGAEVCAGDPVRHLDEAERRAYLIADN
jgi:transposase-like protein